MRDWLKKIREDKDLLQKEVVRAVGITNAHYNFIENGKRRPSPEVAKKIADLLGFDWTLFFENDNSR